MAPKCSFDNSKPKKIKSADCVQSPPYEGAMRSGQRTGQCDHARFGQLPWCAFEISQDPPIRLSNMPKVTFLKLFSCQSLTLMQM